MFTSTGPRNTNPNVTYRPASNSAPPITWHPATSQTQCDFKNTSMNWPAWPGIGGGGGRKLKNPLRPKKTKIKPSKIRAMMTTILMKSPCYSKMLYNNREILNPEVDLPWSSVDY